MPRTSAAAREIPAVQVGQRAEPLPGLSTREKRIWRAVVRDEPADWFRTHALQLMLSDYCRHEATVEVISRRIVDMGPDALVDEPRKVEYLLRLRDREARAAADKAVKLRLTNQSRHTAQAAGTAAKKTKIGGMPWEAF